MVMILLCSSRSFVAPAIIQSSSSNSSSMPPNNNNHILICCKLISPNIVSQRNVSSISYSWMSRRGRHNSSNKSCSSSRDFVVVYSAVDPSGAGAGGLPPPPHSNWKSWVLGMAVSLIILPFLRHKFGPLFLLTNRIENVVEKAEDVAEMIEKAAETVEKVAEEISDDLPEGGKLKDAIEFIESLAKETAKDVQLVQDLIDQVQDVEDVVENIIHDDIGTQNDKDKKNKNGDPNIPYKISNNN